MENKTKTVLITGGARNIGFAIAKKFASEGYNVCITSRKEEQAKESANEIANEYPSVKVKGYSLNTKDTDDIKSVFAAVEQDFGGISVLIPNAADPGYNQSILTTTPEQFDYVIGSNLRGYFFCCQAAARIMVRCGGGSIVAIGSVHSQKALPNRIVYATSKGGIDVMMRNICYELGKYNIRANTIIVGATYNDRWEGMSQEDYEKKRANWPVGMESYPVDIANAAYFLASDSARTISGTQLAVDSGVLSCMLKYDKEWDSKIDNRIFKLK